MSIVSSRAFITVNVLILIALPNNATFLPATEGSRADEYQVELGITTTASQLVIAWATCVQEEHISMKQWP